MVSACASHFGMHLAVFCQLFWGQEFGELLFGLALPALHFFTHCLTIAPSGESLSRIAGFLHYLLVLFRLVLGEL